LVSLVVDFRNCSINWFNRIKNIVVKEGGATQINVFSTCKRIILIYNLLKHIQSLLSVIKTHTKPLERMQVVISTSVQMAMYRLCGKELLVSIKSNYFLFKKVVDLIFSLGVKVI